MDSDETPVGRTASFVFLLYNNVTLLPPFVLS